MRDIKFRYTYKRKEDGKLYQVIYPFECIEKGTGGFSDLLNNNLWEIIGRDLYTGLKDKNKDEIYEGDILKAKMYDEKRLYVVQYYEDGFEGKDTKLLGNRQSAFHIHSLIKGEIIGNIYENPELLKK